MRAVAPGDVVDKLQLLSAASIREGCGHIGKPAASAVGSAAIRASIVEGEVRRKCCFRICEAWRPKDSGIPIPTGDKVVHQVRSNCIGIVHLRYRPWLIALSVKERTNRTRAAGL